MTKCATAVFGGMLLCICFTIGCERDSESASQAIKRGNDLLIQNDADKAIIAYSKAIRLDPKNDEALRCRASAYYAKHEYEKALADDSTAIQLSPTANAYGCRGYTWLSKKNFDSAIADFTVAIRLAPSDVAGWSGRAAAYDGKGEADKAIADYTESIRLDPNSLLSSVSYFRRGIMYDMKGEKSKADKDFARAKQIDPNIEDWAAR